MRGACVALMLAVGIAGCANGAPPETEAGAPSPTDTPAHVPQASLGLPGLANLTIPIHVEAGKSGFYVNGTGDAGDWVFVWLPFTERVITATSSLTFSRSMEARAASPDARDVHAWAIPPGLGAGIGDLGSPHPEGVWRLGGNRILVGNATLEFATSIQNALTHNQADDMVGAGMLFAADAPWNLTARVTVRRPADPVAFDPERLLVVAGTGASFSAIDVATGPVPGQHAIDATLRHEAGWSAVQLHRHVDAAPAGNWATVARNALRMPDGTGGEDLLPVGYAHGDDSNASCTNVLSRASAIHDGGEITMDILRLETAATLSAYAAHIPFPPQLKPEDMIGVYEC